MQRLNSKPSPNEVYEAEESLSKWEESIVNRDEKLKKISGQDEDIFSSENKRYIPPIRGQKKSESQKVFASSSTSMSSSSSNDGAKKISGYDFRAWEKFDVDKALEEIDADESKRLERLAETSQSFSQEEKSSAKRRSEQFQTELKKAIEDNRMDSLSDIQRQLLEGCNSFLS